MGYIFDRNNIVGEKIRNVIDETNEMDEHVTEIFTDMISNFARTGKPNISIKSENNTWLPKIVPNFSESNSFVSISSVPKMMENFRYDCIGIRSIE